MSRSDSGAMMFDCSYGSTILGSAMSELSLFLPRDQIYGLTGMNVSFTADTNFASKAMYKYVEILCHKYFLVVLLYSAICS